MNRQNSTRFAERSKNSATSTARPSLWPDRFSSLARELVALAPSVIVCVGRRETTALLAATRKIPVVFMQVNDPVEQGFVASLAQPGGNTTGFTQMSAELDSKRLQ